MNSSIDISSASSPVVMVVTNNPQTAKLWVSIFREKGCLVINEVPAHALQTTRLLLPQIVLVDAQIPHAERLSLSRQLKSFSRAALLMLIPSHPQEVGDAYAAGVDECLIQPINPALVVVKAMAWMVRQQLMGAQNFALESYI